MMVIVQQDISTALGNFDRRTIEQVLTRLGTRVPPRHLADLHPVTVIENEGKMRRQRYYTIKHYRKLLQEQNLPDDRYNWLHMDNVGDFSCLEETMFWKSQPDLEEFLSTMQDVRSKKVPKKPQKKKPPKNPVVNGVVKKGRPRNSWNQDEVLPNGDVPSEPKKPAKKRKFQFVMEDGRRGSKKTDGDDVQPVKVRKKKKVDQPMTNSSTLESLPSSSADVQHTLLQIAHEFNSLVKGVNSTKDVTMSDEAQLITEATIGASGSNQSMVARKKAKKRPADDLDTSVSMPPKKKQKTATEPAVPVLNATAPSGTFWLCEISYLN